MIKWIEQWYNSHCNGNWEHDHVIKIESLDNPGWHVEINFQDTDISLDDFLWKVYEKSENDWIGYSIKNNIYTASGDSLKLNLLLEVFKNLIEGNELAFE